MGLALIRAEGRKGGSVIARKRSNCAARSFLPCIIIHHHTPRSHHQFRVHPSFYLIHWSFFLACRVVYVRNNIPWHAWIHKVLSNRIRFHHEATWSSPWHGSYQAVRWNFSHLGTGVTMTPRRWVRYQSSRHGRDTFYKCKRFPLSSVPSSPPIFLLHLNTRFSCIHKSQISFLGEKNSLEPSVIFKPLSKKTNFFLF